MCFSLCFVGNSSSPHFSFPFRVFRKNPFLFSFFDFGKKKPFPFFLFRFLRNFSISIPFSFLIFKNRDFLSKEGGLILKGDRLVVSEVDKELLWELHLAHDYESSRISLLREITIKVPNDLRSRKQI